MCLEEWLAELKKLLDNYASLCYEWELHYWYLIGYKPEQIARMLPERNLKPKTFLDFELGSVTHEL